MIASQSPFLIITDYGETYTSQKSVDWKARANCTTCSNVSFNLKNENFIWATLLRKTFRRDSDTVPDYFGAFIIDFAPRSRKCILGEFGTAEMDLRSRGDV